MPNDSELNCNYSLYRREPTTKPTNRFLCFHTTAVVIALPACLKIISLQGGEGLLLLHENRTGGAHIRNLLVFSLGLPNLWLYDFTLFGRHLFWLQGAAVRSKVAGGRGIV